MKSIRNSIGMSAAELRRLAKSSEGKAPKDEIAAWLAEADRLDNVASGGRLTLISRLHAFGLYRCHCGNTKRIALESVARGVVRSCGCLQESTRRGAKPKMAAKPGTIYGWWEVLGEALSEHRRRRVRARCKCGREFVLYANSLHRGLSKACRHCSKTDAYKNFRAENRPKLDWVRA